MSVDLITSYRGRPFSPGFNNYADLEAEAGLKFQILLLEAGGREKVGSDTEETAVVVIEGKGSLRYRDEQTRFHRTSWVEENPTVVHFSRGETLTVAAEGETRLAIISTMNEETFEGRVYAHSEIDVEHRGKDLLDGTCYRLVRLAFDQSIAPEAAKLVLGEVLNFPGKWSSYPPHHHEQPEIYYYEFSPKEGYGHGELGSQVFKIQNKDLLVITGNRDHSQVSAPGYHMYYIWAIRHLEGKPYAGFEFTPPYDRLLD
ncbi:MAG: 5-deoxy-glucuronate isomerase [Candidatus Neomarinimicrobiota bacterium]